MNKLKFHSFISKFQNKNPSGADGGREVITMFRSKKSLIRENEILKDRLEDVTQQLKNAVNKPPLKYPLKGFYWKYNKIAGIWEFVPYEDFSFNDIRILNGLKPVAKCPKYPMSERRTQS